MASTVYSVEEVELQNGQTVTLKPLNIRSLREFMKIMQEFQNVEDEEESLSLLTRATGVCLKKQVPELVENQEEFEDALDMPTIYKILEICGGVKLNDPNLLAAAMETLGRD